MFGVHWHLQHSLVAFADKHQIHQDDKLSAYSFF